jgi:hypothetical protein
VILLSGNSNRIPHGTGEAALTPIEIDVQQRADSGTKSGLNRATLDDQKVIKINDLAVFGLLATDQKVRSSNLFGRAILPIDPFQAGPRFGSPLV